MSGVCKNCVRLADHLSKAEVERDDAIRVLSDATKERDEYREALGRIVMARSLVGSSPAEVADDVIELGAYAGTLADLLARARTEMVLVYERLIDENEGDAVDAMAAFMEEIDAALAKGPERPSDEWYRRKIVEAGDPPAQIGPGAVTEINPALVALEMLRHDMTAPDEQAVRRFFKRWNESLGVGDGS